MAESTTPAGMVRCKLRRSYGYKGQYYGPGDNVAIPSDLQIALSAQFADADALVIDESADDKKAKAK